MIFDHSTDFATLPLVYAIIAGAALLGELGHPKERAFLGSMFNAFYGVGAVLGAGIVVRTIDIQNDWSWRLPSLMQACPSLIQLVFAFTVPESPRWLVSKDRSEEALQILIKYHAEGDASNELPHIELAEIRKALEIENESRKRGWVELFQTPSMRRRSLVSGALGLFVQFSGNSLISQYLVPILEMIGITDRHQQVRYNVGKEAWGLLVSIILAAITPRYPRRRMYLLCASCLLLCYTGWTVAQARNRITGSVESGYAVLVFIFLYSPAYCLGYNALTYVYMVEIFPYYVRTKGLSWFQLWSRSAVMFSKSFRVRLRVRLLTRRRQLRQPDRAGRHWLEVPIGVRVLALLRGRLHLLLLPRDVWQNAGGTGVFVRRRDGKEGGACSFYTEGVAGSDRHGNPRVGREEGLAGGASKQHQAFGTRRGIWGGCGIGGMSEAWADRRHRQCVLVGGEQHDSTSPLNDSMIDDYSTAPVA